MSKNNLIENFLTAMEYAEGVSANTIRSYEKDLATFFVFVAYQNRPKDLTALHQFIREADISSVGIDKIKNLKEDDINRYLKFLTVELQNGTSTKNRRLSCLKSFYKFCKKAYGTDNIMQDKKLLKKTKNKAPKYLSDEESALIVASLKKDCNYYRNKLILSLAINGGLRVSEIKSLTTDNIKDNALTFLGKGNKERSVPMNQTLQIDYQEFLATRKVSSKELFSISVRSIERMVTLAAHKINREDISIHGLRHTFATRLVRKGIDVETIGELMGHADITSTQTYFHTDQANKLSAVMALDA